MKTYEEALKLVLEHAQSTKPEKVNLHQAINRVLLESVKTNHPLPPFTNSEMDGYAISIEDLATASPSTPISLTISQTLSAGDSSQDRHLPGQAARIMTGAPLPEGSDAVVPQEDVEASEGFALFRAPATKGQFIRFAGEDLPAGSIVLNRGERLRAGALGSAAATGITKLSVAKRPRVALIATGNEIVQPGTELLPGQIYNSNLYTLQAQVEEAGGEVVKTLTAADDYESIKTAFEQCCNCDAIITSGGVSVGDKDYLRPVIEEMGHIIFWQAAIRPGKPVALGRIGGSLILALPGNPSSSFVTFELFGRPMLLNMQGARITSRRSIPATLTADVNHEPGRRSFVRVLLSFSGLAILATPTGSQRSGMITTAAVAEGLLIIPEHQTGARSGVRARVILLD